MQEQWLIPFYPTGNATQWLGWVSFSIIFFFCNQAYMEVQKHYLLITEITLESHIFSLRNRYLLESHRTLRYFKLLSSSLPNLLSYYLTVPNITNTLQYLPDFFSTIVNVLHSFIFFHININSWNCNPFTVFAEGSYILQKVYVQYIFQFTIFHLNDKGCCCPSINPKDFFHKALIYLFKV